MSTDSAHRAAELAARVSYGRLLAILASRTKDVAGAEDSLAEAFASALRTWPDRGIPVNPDAWLLAAARNALSNSVRHKKVHEAAALDLEMRASMSAADVQTFPDERLKLMFVCAHPSIDEAARTPLMLQTVLGLDAARIANAFLVAPSTMGQRLVRAKTKIRDAGLRFAVPEQDDIPDRMTDVLNAMYAAFGTGWDAVAGADERFPGLVDEAIYLARLMVGLMPNEPEAKGLLALMLYCEARRPARRGPSGEFIPLREQDAGLWLRDRINRGREFADRRIAGPEIRQVSV
jgi:RNA polymerase sigma-70 factor (ECF subfamily)